jgi:hypothetical protein
MRAICSIASFPPIFAYSSASADSAALPICLFPLCSSAFLGAPLSERVSEDEGE